MDFTIQLKSSPDKLFTILTDFERFPKLIPRQLKDVRIIKTEKQEVFTEETLVFKTIIKNEINQKCIHKIEDNKLTTKIISGPAQNTTIIMSLVKNDLGTSVSVDINLKLILKAKVFFPLIKKIYRNLLTGIFYKIDNLAIEKDEEIG
tara:strand:- start:749 stop:1192 length:444 start_codon:yes stop_codon:yes gene_type:complete